MLLTILLSASMFAHADFGGGHNDHGRRIPPTPSCVTKEEYRAVPSNCGPTLFPRYTCYLVIFSECTDWHTGRQYRSSDEDSFEKGCVENQRECDEIGSASGGSSPSPSGPAKPFPGSDPDKDSR